MGLRHQAVLTETFVNLLEKSMWGGCLPWCSGGAELKVVDDVQLVNVSTLMVLKAARSETGGWWTVPMPQSAPRPDESCCRWFSAAAERAETGDDDGDPTCLEETMRSLVLPRILVPTISAPSLQSKGGKRPRTVGRKGMSSGN